LNNFSNPSKVNEQLVIKEAPITINESIDLENSYSSKTKLGNLPLSNNSIETEKKKRKEDIYNINFNLFIGKKTMHPKEGERINNDFASYFSKKQ